MIFIRNHEPCHGWGSTIHAGQVNNLHEPGSSMWEILGKWTFSGWIVVFIELGFA